MQRRCSAYWCPGQEIEVLSYNHAFDLLSTLHWTVFQITAYVDEDCHYDEELEMQCQNNMKALYFFYF